MAEVTREDIQSLTAAIKSLQVSVEAGGGDDEGVGRRGGGGRGGGGGGIVGVAGAAAGALGAAAAAAGGLGTILNVLGQEISGSIIPGLSQFGEALSTVGAQQRRTASAFSVGYGAMSDVESMLAPFALAGLDVPSGVLRAATSVAIQRRGRQADLHTAIEAEIGRQAPHLLPEPPVVGAARGALGGGLGSQLQRAFNRPLDILGIVADQLHGGD